MKRPKKAKWSPRKPDDVVAMRPEALDLMFEIQQDRRNVYDGSVCIVSVCGPLDHHPSGVFDSYDEIAQRVEEAFTCEDVRSVILKFDSPGGDAYGATQTAKKIRRLASETKKNLYAYSNECMASAAYELGCVADEVWLPSTGVVGSVGVISILEDRTAANKKAGLAVTLITTGKAKADRRPDRVLTDEIVARAQDQVDTLGEVFFRLVSKHRGISVEQVAKLEAGVFYGKDAIKAGLADGVADWDQFLSLVKSAHGDAPPKGTPSLTRQSVGKSSKARAEVRPTPTEIRLMSIKTKLLALIKQKDATLASIGTAKSDDNRKKLLAQLDALASKIAAKQAKAEDEEEEEEESSDEDESEETEDSDDDDGDDDSDDDDSDDDESEESEDDGDDDEDEDDEEDEEAAAKALTAHKGRRATALFKAAQKLTGKKGLGEVFGALDAMTVRLKAAAKTEARVAKLEQSNRRQRVTALLDKAKTDGRVTPKQVAALAEQGMKDPKWLKGYLSTLPKRVRNAESELTIPDQQFTNNKPPSITDQMNMLGSSGVPQTDIQKMQAAISNGLTEDEKKNWSEIQEKAAAKANGIFNVNGGNGNATKGPRF
jgi:signal peptide peptidase SppA